MPHTGFDDSAIDWQPFGDFPHFQFAILHVDPARQLADVMFRFAAGQQIVLHRHKALNHTFVIRGEHRLYEMDGRLREVRPTGSYTVSPASEAPHREGGGAEDVIVGDDGAIEVLTAYADFELVKQATENPKTKKHVVVTVELLTDDELRTLDQNSLYWLWLTAIGNHFGNAKDEQHKIFKRKFLSVIYVRDDREFASMAESVGNLRNIIDGVEYENIAQGVAKLMSTTKATVKQMSEYLTDIDAFCQRQQIKLPIPSEYEWVLRGSDDL